MELNERDMICLDSERFDEMRNALDRYIRQAMSVMEGKDSNAASITLKIDFEREQVAVGIGDRAWEAILPGISYKLSMKTSSEYKFENEIVKKGEMEAVKDLVGRYYMVSHEEGQQVAGGGSMAGV